MGASAHQLCTQVGACRCSWYATPHAGKDAARSEAPAALLFERQYLAGDDIVSRRIAGQFRPCGRGSGARVGAAFPLQLVADDMGEPALWAVGIGTARTGVSRAASSGAANRAVRVHLGLVLPRAVHEPVPFR